MITYKIILFAVFQFSDGTKLYSFEEMPSVSSCEQHRIILDIEATQKHVVIKSKCIVSFIV